MDNITRVLTLGRVADASRKAGHLINMNDGKCGRAEEMLLQILGVLSDVHTALSEPAPVPMILTCPACNVRHIDRGEFATKSHHTHSCQACGLTWRPAVVPTVGVQFLPGFKDASPDPATVKAAIVEDMTRGG